MKYKRTTQYVSTQGVDTVQTFITKGKQRLKRSAQAESGTTTYQVYLKDGDNFEIELSNNKSNKVLTRIKMDGKYLSGGGIILRPGERVFLERFLDSANKFQFRTYSVSGQSEQVRKAIASNGNVEVEFFDEYIPLSINYGGGGITWNSGHYWQNTGSPWINNPVIGGHTTTLYNSSGMANATFTSAVTNTYDVTLDANCANTSNVGQTRSAKKIETGRVEKGDVSNQSFVTDNSQFNIYPFQTIRYKILPVSEKVYHSTDIRVYCTECGARIKKSNYKFCPHCGTKTDN